MTAVSPPLAMILLSCNGTTRAMVIDREMRAIDLKSKGVAGQDDRRAHHLPPVLRMRKKE